MTIQHRKSITAAAWVIGVLIAGLSGGVASGPAWVILAALALLPPLVLMRLWSAPPQTMSESIQNAKH